MKPSTIKGALITLASTFILILFWKILSLFLGIELILPSPEATLRGFLKILVSSAFWPSVLSTLARGVVGFLVAFCSGLIIGTLAGLFPLFHLCLKPLLTVIKSTPVISIILLALIWFHTTTVPVFVAFLMTFPIICANTIAGIRGVDISLVQMARAYSVSKKQMLFGVYLPSIAPFVISGASTALGITWKVVIAAEVLAMPLFAVGTRMQNARINLETAEVFAWTLISILLSSLGEVLMDLLYKKVNWNERNKD